MVSAGYANNQNSRGRNQKLYEVVTSARKIVILLHIYFWISLHFSDQQVAATIAIVIWLRVTRIHKRQNKNTAPEPRFEKTKSTFLLRLDKTSYVL